MGVGRALRWEEGELGWEVEGGTARWEWGGQVGGRGGLGWRSKVRWEVLGLRWEVLGGERGRGGRGG